MLYASEWSIGMFIPSRWGGMEMPCDPTPYKPRRPYGGTCGRKVDGHEVEWHVYPERVGIEMPCDPMPYEPRRPCWGTCGREVDVHEVEWHVYPPRVGG